MLYIHIEMKSKNKKLRKLKKGGMAMDKEPRRQSKGEHSVQTKSKRGAEMVKMCGGGMKKSGRNR